MSKKVFKSSELSQHLNLKEKVDKASDASGSGIVTGSSGKVLNKEVLLASDKARGVIQDASSDAEKIKAEARDILGQVKAELERARKEGFAKGREEGLASFTENVAAFEKMKEDFYGSAEENIIKLSMMVAEKVIGKMVNEHKEAIRSIVVQAVENALGEKVTVRLSPEDLAMIKSSESEFRNVLDNTKRIVFKEDDSITRGGCVVESEVGTIDARLETQLKAIKKALEL